MAAHLSQRALLLTVTGFAGGVILGKYSRGWHDTTTPPTSSTSPFVRDGEGSHQTKWWQAFDKENILQHGLPNEIELKFRKGHVVCYDRERKQPRWVLEKITKAMLKRTQDDVTDRSRSTFRQDATTPRIFRSKASDYMRSGYDRGHNAPAADFKYSQKAMDDTFYLSNVSPQVGKGFNRDYWARLESFTRSLVFRPHVKDVLVFTGPLFIPARCASVASVPAIAESIATSPRSSTSSSTSSLPAELPSIASSPPPKSSSKGYQYVQKFIGRDTPRVAVPTHFYKIVLVRRKIPAPLGGTGAQPKFTVSYEAAAFVVPNERVNETVPLNDFLTPIEDVQRWSGLNFFPGLFPLRYEKREKKAAVLKDDVFHKQEDGQEGDVCLDGHATPSLPTTAIMMCEGASDSPSVDNLCRHEDDCVLPPPRWWLLKKKKPSETDVDATGDVKGC